MRKLFSLLFFFLLFSQVIFSSPASDSIPVKSSTPTDTTAMQSTSAKDSPAENEVGTGKDSTAQVAASSIDTSAAKKCNCCIPSNPVPLGPGWLLVFTPLAVFLIIFFMIGKGNGFVFKDALTENEQTKKTIKNPEYSAEKLLTLQAVLNLSALIPPTIEVTDLPQKEITDDRDPAKETLKSAAYSQTIYRPSISRYIAFITSMLTLVIALAMSCFFIYRYISVGCPPDFSALSTILIALGFGIAPYAFNKVATAVKGRDS